MILLYLIRQKDLEIPMLYMSEYFENNRNEYYSLLLDVSMNGNYLSWIKFFLNGVIVQSNSIIKKTNRLIVYYDNFYKQIKTKTKSRNVIGLFQKLFSNPYITIPMVARKLDISYPTAKKLICVLIDLNILQPIEIGDNAKTFEAKNILDIYTEKEEDT